MLPVRCFSCNALTGHLWDEYIRLRQTHDGKACLDQLGLRRMCCRRMLMTHVDIVSDLAVYSATNRTLDGSSTEWHAEVEGEREASCD